MLNACTEMLAPPKAWAPARPRPHVSARRDVGGEARADKTPTDPCRTDSCRIPVQTLERTVAIGLSMGPVVRMG